MSKKPHPPTPPGKTQALRERADAALTGCAVDWGEGTELTWSWTEDKNGAPMLDYGPREAASDVATVLALAGLVPTHRGRRIVVRDALGEDGNPTYARTRRTADDVEVSLGQDGRLLLAWALRSWLEPGWAQGTYRPDADPLVLNLWRHVIECDDVSGEVEVAAAVRHYGMPSTGVAEAKFRLRCGCGFLRIGTQNDRVVARSIDELELHTLLGELEQLRAEYLDADVRHAPWTPLRRYPR